MPDNGSSVRNKLGIGLFAVAVAFLAIAIGVAMWQEGSPRADPEDVQLVARGKPIYDRLCASCHGARLEGQLNWQEKLPSGRMPAPPHDASGHTWHHPDEVLFGITKHGLVPGKYAPLKYESDMPAFAAVLTDDDIWAVLAYIKSSWPENIRRAQREIDAGHRRR